MVNLRLIQWVILDYQGKIAFAKPKKIKKRMGAEQVVLESYVSS